MAGVDWKKMSTIDRVVVIAGAVALIAMFLPWYGYTSGAFSASVSGFSSGYGWLGALLVVAAGAYLLFQRSGSKMPVASMGPGVMVLGLSGIGTLLVAIRWITLPRGSFGVANVAYFSYGPRVGIILALIAGIVQVVCALRLFRRSGESVPWAK